MQKTDNIAILMAVFNGEKYISEQINSILTQTETRWTLFIHDDGSTDRTPEIINHYKKHYPDRICILPGPPSHSAKNNFFFLMNQVQAPYIMFCDQDDIWLPHKVEITLKRMHALENEIRNHDAPLLVFSDLCVVDCNLKPIADRISAYQKLDPHHIRTKDLMIQNVITGCTIMINNPLLKIAIKIKNSENIIMHDWWCALIASYYGQISFIDDALVMYRQHGNNSIGAKNVNSIDYLYVRVCHRTDIRNSLLQTQLQTETFIKTFSITDPILSEYSHLHKKKKLQRLMFFIKNGVYKCGWQRNAGLLFWG